MCTTAEGKVLLLDKPDSYSWKEWHQKLYISTTEKKHTVAEIQNKRDIRPSCTFTALFPSPQQQALDDCCPLLDDLWSRSSLLQRRWRQYHLEPSFWPDGGCLSGCGSCCSCGCDGYGVWPCVGWDCGTLSSWGQPCCHPLSWNQNCPKSCARHP